MRTKLAIIFSIFTLFGFAGNISNNLSIPFNKKDLTNSSLVLKNEYEKEWKKVDSLIDLRLSESALKVVLKIYKTAKQENNATQFIKAIMYKMKLENEYQEDSYENSIKNLEIELKDATYPVKPILHSVLAEMYWRYYSMNRYEWLERTETIDFTDDDIKTWDLKKLLKKVIAHYISSLEEKDLLKSTKLDAYDDIILKDTDTRLLRPSLYDFIAHRAVDFFINDESELTKPIYNFNINSEDYFKPSNEFVKLSIINKDSLSLKYYATKILQDLIAFHLTDDDPSALIDVEIKRLKFIKSNASIENKDSLYLNALLELEKRFNKDESSTEVAYEIAEYYLNKGNNYTPSVSEENKWMIKNAFEKCNEAIKAFPNSYGGKKCNSLLFTITEKSIRMTVEEGNAPEKPFRSLFQYKNVSTVTFRIIKITHDENEKLIKKYYGEELIKQYVKKPVLKEWDVTFPNDGDYQEHAAEIKIDALPYGFYVILASNTSTFSLNKQLITYSDFWVTDLSFIKRTNEDGNFDFYVLDRETGKPIKGVIAQPFIIKYNNNTRELEKIKEDKYITDTDGYFKLLNKNTGYNHINIEFSNEKDFFISQNSFYQYSYNRDINAYQEKTYFFTDRAIYRPGQTIYFKGILLQTDSTGKKYEIKPNTKTMVILNDVNNQKVSEIELTSNEYGTFTGTFTAPAEITGMVTIANPSGMKDVLVEEYKRPKFEVKFNPVKGSYKLNELLTIKGTATAYAGNVIDQAQVQYRVVRNASFPRWWFWWRGHYPISDEIEITNGVTTTNEKGEFDITFKAIPDLSIEKKSNPTYTFTVYADVTDLNGETHSAQEAISVGYESIKLAINLPSELEKSHKGEFEISVTNLNGEKDTAKKGTIKIFKLKQAQKVFRKREWQKPDKFLMTQEEYFTLFPYDIYDDEDNMYKWEKEENVFEMIFESPQDSLVKIKNLKKWKLGSYVLEAKAFDKYGEEVTYFSYFTVYDKNENPTPTNTASYFNMVKSYAEPGDSISFIIATRDTDTRFHYEIEYDGKIIMKEWVKLNNEQKQIYIPIKEEYRGGLALHVFNVKHNRCNIYKETVRVPYTNKELDIAFETYRDKLLPGQQEEWKIKIKGNNGEKVLAEMLAAMYDASLDSYAPNAWYFDIYNSLYSYLSWDKYYSYKTKVSNTISFYKEDRAYIGYRKYESLNWFGFYYGNRYKSLYALDEAAPVMSIAKGEVSQSVNFTAPEVVNADDMIEEVGGMGMGGGENITNELSGITARSNFNETAFFYPQLQTNENGEVVISFVIPEALTKWKMMGLATTKDLKVGQIEKTLLTQKELMIVPNAPRFFREGDKITFTAKVSNLTENELNGNAQLFLYDAISMKEIDGICKNTNALKTCLVKKGESVSVSWDFEIPEELSAIKYKVVAKAGNFTDGEEMTIPVLNNRMLVTETLPLQVNGKETKEFTFEKLLHSKSSTTIKNHKLTLEYTSNPAWYAIQALPYLLEYPYDCAEQVFSRYFANSIASHIVNSYPKIKSVFESWKNLTPNTLLSNLEKNQELKSLLLEETPWVMDAQNENERKQRISLLFDLNKMSYELKKALKQLEKMQLSNGGWPWFGGVKDDRYISQYIITGFGHLDNLKVKDVREDETCWTMVKKGVQYLDNKMREDYEDIKKYSKKEEINKNHLSALNIQYLYARSYFINDIAIDKKNKEAFDYFSTQAKTYWNQQNRYLQGMIALALHRLGEKKEPQAIIKSLKENALVSEEMGMYWKEMSSGYYWYQSHIEKQSLLIEAFDEVADDTASVEKMKTWLLKQKQTQNWKTSKATTEACYSLLLRGTNWLASDQLVEITLGKEKINPLKMEDMKIEAGTGYFKTSWSGENISSEMGNVKVKKLDAGVSWGALYWQYFENLDKITEAETPLKLEKKLFVTKTSDTGPLIQLITDTTNLKVGDKIKVRIELTVDRDMEYVHMKDMRASGFEPINVISQYKFQDGLGYYESTRDAATNFFFSYLPKGTYVFEYPLWVTHKGDFSNGITTIQCMYAPEFSSHSEGKRVNVGE